MEHATYDPGLTQKYYGVLNRAINKDGQFNVLNSGANWHDAHPDLYLINPFWMKFFLLVAITFAIVHAAPRLEQGTPSANRGHSVAGADA